MTDAQRASFTLLLVLVVVAVIVGYETTLITPLLKDISTFHDVRLNLAPPLPDVGKFIQSLPQQGAATPGIAHPTPDDPYAGGNPHPLPGRDVFTPPAQP